ncbi:hypothetical protein L910_1702 [Vibrio fluvialis PG41]|uniref:Uncharacterized protein n=1 Tax=Vibrio fluvialis PG41 TaxID=1336752 RepID=S7HYK4_VIBFL|nr:hypothetical protein L910_1702 [Vibrio fluvialis PG41]
MVENSATQQGVSAMMQFLVHEKLSKTWLRDKSKASDQ